jgi:2-keto-4-pentenoate hydratase
MVTAIVALTLALTACISTQQRTADVIFDAWRAQRALPLAHVVDETLTRARVDETLTIESAYQVQRALVWRQLQGARPAGFKAGLTSSAAQARFKATGPITGVLVSGPAHTPLTLGISELSGLHIETEVALRVGSAITQRVASVDELKAYIDGIAPAVDLPNLYYENPAQLQVADIVASNMAATHAIVGDFVAPSHRDPNSAAPRLLCDGTEVNVGQGRDALGDQWRATLWLVNSIIDQGWRIEPGQILMTGSLGRMVAAKPGHCSADFGEWGRLEITVAP